jgi:trimeric autotransporter adhesin
MKIFTLFAAVTFVCFALSPSTRAVVPAPDGGYPGANTAEGQSALFSLTTGGYNTAVGYLSLRSNTTASFNTAIGTGALLANIGASNGAGDENTATGAGVLLSNNTGTANTANGAFALFNNTTGGYNTANGFHALFSNSTAYYNTAIGENALSNNTIGAGNVALGFNACSGVTTADNVICIGGDVSGANVTNSCYIGSIFGATSSGGTAVFINMNGRLGTMTSSRRFKEEIKPMDKASEALFALKPVAFRYKKDIDPAGTPQLGLVAEDVEKVNPDLVVRDKEGNPYSVRYDQVNAMLLNEFLKEHREVQEPKKQVAPLTVAVRPVRYQTTGDQLT